MIWVFELLSPSGHQVVTIVAVISLQKLYGLHGLKRWKCEMSRLRTHGRTNMWKYSAWAESAIFNIGVDFHWCVENNNDALRMARLLCEAISNALWSQYQRLSEQTISMLCPRLSSASSPWLASPHCNTTHTDVQLWSKCSSRIYVFSAISHWFYFLNCGFCL